MSLARPISLLALALVCAAWAGPVAAEEDGISDGVVKIGLVLDMSGLYADITGTGSETAARMAVEDYGGKVLGKPIEVVVADHQNKPDIASAIARQWFDQEHVDAILDVAASATALAVISVAKDRHKIVSVSGPGAASITNESCTPYSVHYVYDTYALAHSTGKAVLQQGGKSWFFITADYAFGHQLEADTAAVVREDGGEVLGHALVPLNNADFSSFLLQAQQSKAKIIGLANAGGDTINSIKQAAEFGIVQGGQRLAGLLVFLNDVHSLGLQTAQGLVLTSAFYWNMNDETRAWSRRFFERQHKMPNMAQAGVYSSVRHYLDAVAAAGTDASDPVMAKMRAMPINDFFVRNGRIREDGLMVHDLYLFQVKSPAESKEPWDYYKLLATIPGDQAFNSLAETKCPLVKK